jgi:hypothetical protein
MSTQPKPEVAPEHKGTKTYMVGPSRHYRGGKLYKAGELVTVTDERPARDWVLVENKGAVKAPAPAPAPSKTGRASDQTGRASDQTVG